MSNEKDNSSLSTILALIIIVVGVISLYMLGAPKKAEKPAPKTEKVSVQKNENTQKAKENIKPEKPKLNLPFQKYNFNYVYTITVTGKMKSVTFKAAIPKNDNLKQYISGLNISPKPTKTYSDGINNIAEFTFENVSQGKININISGVVNQNTYDYITAQKVNKNPSKETDLTQYLKPSYLIESNDPGIVKVAQTLKGSTQKETVDNVFNYLQKNMKYNIGTKLMGAKDVLKIKQGKCMDYSNLMIALLRANNVPARYVAGNMIVDGYSSHAWVEVYYDQYGWVVYDPTIMAMATSYKDAQGNVRTSKPVIDPSNSHGRRYVASAKNMESAISVAGALDGRNKGHFSLSENTQINRLQ